MKKIISITIALCLVFCSILPVYADPWTNTQADTVTRNSTGILSQITNLNSLFTQFFTIRNISGGNVTATFQDFYDLFASLCAWIIPSNPSQTGLSLWDFTLLIATRVNDLWGGWDSYFSNLTAIPSILSNLTSNGTALGSPNFIYRQNFVPYSTPTAYTINSNSLSVLTRDINGQLAVGWPNRNPASLRQLLLIMANNNMLQFSTIYSIGTKYIRSAYDKFSGSGLTQQDPYTYLSLMDLMYDSVDSIHLIDKFYWHTLQHYGDNLTTWDSQGSTLTQVAFTPDSAIQGLYRYLAFTQRDVARLAYVFANDEELEARELAQANQEQVLDDFIDPNGSSSVSTTDLGSMSNASSDFKSNFSTNVGSSHIWDVFDNSRYNWFTQQTKNQLDTTQQTRSLKAVQNDYPTPLLDNYYDEISRIIGVDIND